MKSSMHNHATKISIHEKRWVKMQDTGDELAINRTNWMTHNTNEKEVKDLVN